MFHPVVRADKSKNFNKCQLFDVLSLPGPGLPDTDVEEAAAKIEIMMGLSKKIKKKGETSKQLKLIRPKY